MKQICTLGFLAGLVAFGAACGSKENKSETLPKVPTDPLPSSYSIEVGDWSFLYAMPADAFVFDSSVNGSMAEDLDGFIRVADTGENVDLGGSFRHQPCKELDGVIKNGSRDLTLANPLSNGISIEQNLRNLEYSFRVLAGFEIDDGKGCVSFAFHSRKSYKKEIDFAAPSELRDAIVLSLNSLARKS